MILFWGAELLASFLECFIGLIFVGDLLGVQIKRYRDCVFPAWIVTIGVVMLNRIQLISVLTMLFAAVGLTLCACFLYRKSVLSVLSAVGSYILMLYLQEYFLLLMAEIMFAREGFGIDTLMEHSWIRVFLIIFAKIFLVLSCFLFHKILHKKSGLSGRLVVGLIISSGLLFNLVIEISRNAEDAGPGTGFAVFFIAALGIFLILQHFEIGKQRQQMKLRDERHHMLLKGYEDMVQCYRSNSIYYHDLKNHMLMIEGFLAKREYKKAVDYMDALQKHHTEIGAYRWTGTEAVDFILNHKKEIAEQKGICFVVDADLVNIHEIAETDLCALLGNLLDNAIEGCEREAGKTEIRVSVRRVKEMLLIKSVNSCQSPLSYKSGLPMTAKEDKNAHGWGMRSMRAVVEKYGGTMQYSYKDGEFSVVIGFFF